MIWFGLKLPTHPSGDARAFQAEAMMILMLATLANHIIVLLPEFNVRISAMIGIRLRLGRARPAVLVP